MAAFEYIIPGGGIYNDTEQGFEPVVPGVGIVNEQEAAAPPGGRTTHNTRSNPLGSDIGSGLGIAA